MSTDKYPSIFSRQMKAIVYIVRIAQPIRLLETLSSSEIILNIYKHCPPNLFQIFNKNTNDRSLQLEY